MYINVINAFIVIDAIYVIVVKDDIVNILERYYVIFGSITPCPGRISGKIPLGGENR